MMATPEERYAAAAHAMQSGVATEMNYDSGPTSPKHLRVGVNAAMTHHASLTKLLIAKGVIREDEYLEAIADGMEREQRRMPEQDHYLTLAEVAEHYRTTEGTFRYWRNLGRGPKGVKLGTRVLYPIAEIEKFDRELAAQAAQPA